MRLHPAEDGLIPMPDERTLTRRDRGGNRLVDVNDPKTGFCTGVRSNLTVPVGMSVFPHTPVSGTKSSSTPDVRFDPERQVYYDLIRSKNTDPIGLVIRTCDDGDAPLTTTRVRVVVAEPSKTRESERKSSAPVRPAQSVRSENNAAVKAVLDAMGYKGKVTPEIRKAVLEMIEIEKNTIAPLVPKQREKGGKPQNVRNGQSGQNVRKTLGSAVSR